MQEVSATYNPLCESDYFHPPLDSTRASAIRITLGKYDVPVFEADLATEEDILRVHSKDYMTKIERRQFNYFDRLKILLNNIPLSDTKDVDIWHRITDRLLSTQVPEDVYKIALASAGCATKALELADKDKGMCFAITQFPGHHAKKSSFSGSCIFNNAAIVAKKALDEYGYEKIAILDIDVHHGNGTQKIIKDDENIIYASIHLQPAFPLTGWFNGKRYQNNWIPIISRSHGCSTFDELYLKYLDDSLDYIKDNNPNILIVSAGFDTYKGDMIGKMPLEQGIYKKIGKKIADATKELDIPTVSVLEGGYYETLPKSIAEFCNAFK